MLDLCLRPSHLPCCATTQAKFGNDNGGCDCFEKFVDSGLTSVGVENW